MGRQVHFYTLPDDRDTFFHFAQKDDLVAVVAGGSDSPIVRPLEQNDFSRHDDVHLWNRRILPHFTREWIPGPRHYGVNELRLPVLQFLGSTLTTWEGKPALVQGRLYGVFDSCLEKPPEFQKWYERLVRWIRRNYRRNPSSMGGYIGPCAYELFRNGGYLLPQFMPPRTDAWLAEIDKQHCKSEVADSRI